MKKAKQSCRTCKFAPEWAYSAKGKIRPLRGGWCKWELPEIVLPKAYYYPWATQQGLQRKCVGYVNHTDGKECPAYQAKDPS
jgi:hypothetical protein